MKTYIRKSNNKLNLRTSSIWTRTNPLILINKILSLDKWINSNHSNHNYRRILITHHQQSNNSNNHNRLYTLISNQNKSDKWFLLSNIIWAFSMHNHNIRCNRISRIRVNRVVMVTSKVTDSQERYNNINRLYNNLMYSPKEKTSPLTIKSRNIHEWMLADTSGKIWEYLL